MAIQTVTCPHCQGLSKVDDSQPHASFRCPHCLGMMALASRDSQPPLKVPELQCPRCTGRFQLPPDLEGDLVKCPHCSETVRVPNCGGERNRVAEPPPSERQSTLDFDPADEVTSHIAAAANKNDQRRQNASSTEVDPAQLLRSSLESTAHEISQSRPVTSTTAPTLDDETGGFPGPQSDGSFVIAVGDQQVTLQDKGKMVDYRGANLRVRELSREEKTKRRRLRNLVLGVGCLVLLVLTAAVLINSG